MDSTPKYAQQSFWNDRYRAHSKPEDWYATWNELKSVLSPLLSPSTLPSLLMVGCGNSHLSQALASQGFHVTNVDISQVVIEKIGGEERSEEYLVMDATNMPFKDRCFDIVMDKGTFDALTSGSNTGSGADLVREMGRVASNLVVFVTFGRPEVRSNELKSALLAVGEWTEEVRQCALSPSAQLANIARSKFPGEGLSAVLKSQTKLQLVLLELVKHLRGQPSDENPLRQDHCWVYLYRRLNSSA